MKYFYVVCRVLQAIYYGTCVLGSVALLVGGFIYFVYSLLKG